MHIDDLRTAFDDLVATVLAEAADLRAQLQQRTAERDELRRLLDATLLARPTPVTLPTPIREVEAPPPVPPMSVPPPDAPPEAYPVRDCRDCRVPFVPWGPNVKICAACRRRINQRTAAHARAVMLGVEDRTPVSPKPDVRAERLQQAADRIDAAHGLEIVRR